MKDLRIALYTMWYYILIESAVFLGATLVTRGVLLDHPRDSLIISSMFCGSGAFQLALDRVFGCKNVTARNTQTDWEWVEEYRPSTERWELERRLVHKYVD